VRITLRSYPGYKNSGVPWLEDIPAHWQLIRGKFVFQSKKEPNIGGANSNVLSLTLRGVVNNDPDDPEGLVPKDYATYQLFNKGDLVFKLIDLENLRTSRVGLVHEAGIMSPAYIRLIPRIPEAVHYFYYQYYDLYLRGIYNQLGAGVRSTLGPVDLLDLPVVVPPTDEWAHIVRFIDSKENQITSFIRAKRRLIALLNEQKQAIIHRAVTRGLDPDVPLKSSGVEWLEEYPAHWMGLPLKRWVSTKITDGPHETPTFVEKGVDFLSAESMVNGHLDFEHRRGYISREVHELYCRKCRPQMNDIFMCKSGATTGKVAIVETDKEFSVWSPLALIRVDPRKVLPYLLYYILQTTYVQEQVRRTWSAGTQPNLSMAAMERLFIALPPLEEQGSVLKAITTSIDPIEQATARAQREIDLIREYRTRLISDVVTGKLDVRSVQLPDVQEAPDLVDLDDIGEEEAGELEPEPAMEV
jgi:type I restriction enzyme, S subunit